MERKILENVFRTKSGYYELVVTMFAGLACSGSESLVVVRDPRVCCLDIQLHRLMDRNSSSALLTTSTLRCKSQYLHVMHILKSCL